MAALGGVPLALGVTASTVCALAEFPAAEAGVASGVFNSLRQVGALVRGRDPGGGVRPRPGGESRRPIRSAGSVWAFASRAIVFVVVLVAVVGDHAAAPRRPARGARLS